MKKLLLLLMTILMGQLLFSIEVGEHAFINDDHVNVRTGPGLNNPVSFQLNKGEKVFICDKTLGDDYVDHQFAHWYLVTTKDDREGSVFGSLLSSQLEMDVINNVPFTIITSNSNYHAIGTDMFRMDREIVGDHSLEVIKYNINDLKEKDTLTVLYQEITDEINSAVQEFEQEQGLTLDLSPDMEDIKVIEMKNKSYYLYNIKYSEEIDLNDENFASLIAAKNWTEEEYCSYGIRLFITGVSVISSGGSSRSLNCSARIILYKDREWDERGDSYTLINRVTDIDGDDNPEVWYSWTGYESCSSWIDFFTEDTIYSSGEVAGDHYEEGPGNVYGGYGR
ncbi:MAG: SH3 domain-containing protein [Spirochaetales bacterium]|nr:SH3 domain-containing protein [Spirochaetales bacterium]